MSPNLTFLRERSALLKQLRTFFDSRSFLEVQPPCLGSDCVVDAHLDPICVASSQLGVQVSLPKSLLLQTSPESAMKRMLAAGAPSIYSIGPVFRSGEVGKFHNVEFTMLEWYDVGAGIDSGIQLLGDVVCECLSKDGFQVSNYRDCFHDAVGIDPIESPIEVLADAARKVDAQFASQIDDDRDALLELLMSMVIQPRLGIEQPLIVKNYPLSQAALAKQSSDDQLCASRFELFAGGVEVANGYDELTNADVFLQRAMEENKKRVALGKEPLPAESTLYKSMLKGLPQSCGVALGVDRLLMLQVDATEISEVIPFTTRNC